MCERVSELNLKDTNLFGRSQDTLFSWRKTEIDEDGEVYRPCLIPFCLTLFWVIQSATRIFVLLNYSNSITFITVHILRKYQLCGSWPTPKQLFALTGKPMLRNRVCSPSQLVLNSHRLLIVRDSHYIVSDISVSSECSSDGHRVITARLCVLQHHLQLDLISP